MKQIPKKGHLPKPHQRFQKPTATRGVKRLYPDMEVASSPEIKKEQCFDETEQHGARKAQWPAGLLGDVLHIHGKKGESQPGRNWASSAGKMRENGD